MSGGPPFRLRPDLPVPPECRALIERGALVAVSHSAGKDSQCMTILLSRIVPREQLLVVHAPLGDVVWSGTVEHIEATLPAGVPLIMAQVSSGKSLLDHVEERGMFPGIHQRWCTAGHYGSALHSARYDDKITMESRSAKALTSFNIKAQALPIVHTRLSSPSMAMSGSDGLLNLPLLICGGTLLESACSRSIGSPRV